MPKIRKVNSESLVAITKDVMSYMNWKIGDNVVIIPVKESNQIIIRRNENDSTRTK